MSAHEIRDLLESGDIEGCRRYWRKHAPNMPQPQSMDEAEKVLHLARTISDTVSFRQRAYSHSWLTERALPSQLPGNLRPRAERMYPTVVEAVGVSVNFTSPHLQPAAVEVRGVMNDIVLDSFANGDRDPELVRTRMLEAKDDTMRRLFGRRVER